MNRHRDNSFSHKMWSFFYFYIDLGRFNVFLNPLNRPYVTTSINVGKNLKGGGGVAGLINLPSLVKLGRRAPQGFQIL